MNQGSLSPAWKSYRLHLEIWELITQGVTQEKIAAKLRVSTRTVQRRSEYGAPKPPALPVDALEPAELPPHSRAECPVTDKFKKRAPFPPIREGVRSARTLYSS
jgi:hypothetical protein